MKLAFASLGLCLAATISLSDVRADEDWSSKYTVTASAKKGADGKVTIEVKGKDGWYINTSYPMKITLSPPDGVTIDKKEIGKDAIEFVGTEMEGKAKLARASVAAKSTAPSKPVEGSYKLVVCSPNSCSPPLKGNFSAAFR